MEILEKQREYFKKGKTLNVKTRMKYLKILKESIFANIDNLVKAFKDDYNKCEFDVYSTEVGLVIKELNYMIRNLKKLTKMKRVRTSLINFPSAGYLCEEPYGNVLVVSPWNYPFQLAMVPLIGAISAGNTVYLKCSRNTPKINQVIKNILSVFNDEYVYVMENTNEKMEQLFDLKFDYIFYTGSTEVAKELVAKQAKYLTPMTLELGGKSPAIVDSDADVENSAKRVVWGKYLNAGQTCVAPDYVLLHKSIKEDFLKYAVKYIKMFYYTNDVLNNNFTSVINKKSIDKLLSLIDIEKVFFGGKVTNNTMEPTILNNITYEDIIMKQEIFGPIMPIIEFNDLEEVIQKMNLLEKPLALYYFGKKKTNFMKVIKRISFGGGCLNDTIMHLCEENLPFGGVGLSGMGYYHGEKTFKTFSHQKSILKKSMSMEMNLKYPPYNDKKKKLTKIYFKIKK